MIGNEDEASCVLDISAELAHAHENPLAQAIHYGLCTETFLFMGQVEPCLDYADRAISISRGHDFAFWLGTGLCMRGWALGQMGQMGLALETLDDGISVFEATGAGIQLANWYGLKAETLLTAGHFKDGIKAAEYALQHADKTADVYFVPRTHVVSARLWAEMNEPGKAAHHTRLAAECAAEFGMADSAITLLI